MKITVWTFKEIAGKGGADQRLVDKQNLSMQGFYWQFGAKVVAKVWEP